MIFLDIHGKQM